MIDRVVKAAKEQNGWVVKGICLVPLNERGIAGTIMFERIAGPEGLGRYGTATVFATLIEDDDVSFEWEHYDMSEEDARKDFAKRVERGY